MAVVVPGDFDVSECRQAFDLPVPSVGRVAVFQLATFPSRYEDQDEEEDKTEIHICVNGLLNGSKGYISGSHFDWMTHI